MMNVLSVGEASIFNMGGQSSLSFGKQILQKRPRISSEYIATKKCPRLNLPLGLIVALIYPNVIVSGKCTTDSLCLGKQALWIHLFRKHLSFITSLEMTLIQSCQPKSQI